MAALVFRILLYLPSTLLCDVITEDKRFQCYRVDIKRRINMNTVKINIVKSIEALADYLYYKLVGCDGSLI